MLSRKDLINIEREYLNKVMEARQHFWYFMESYEEMLMDESTTIEEILNMSEQFNRKLKKLNRICARYIEIGNLINETT